MKTKVGLIFGGRSGEHEVSIQSAASVYQAVNRDKFKLVLLGIKKDGSWVKVNSPEKVFKNRSLKKEDQNIIINWSSTCKDGLLINTEKGKELACVDIMFPLLHGTFGEDGTIQGLFEMADVPYVGAGVLASSVSMDKEVMKALFQIEGLPQIDYSVLKYREWLENKESIIENIKNIDYPCFVKPANLGSSVGISKVLNDKELESAVDYAAAFDHKVIVEKAVEHLREFECSVLGNRDIKVSQPGEIIPSNEFYDYEAKYVSDSELIIPAEISSQLISELKDLAKRTYKAVECTGMARVDFLYDQEDKKVYVNEINTIPGFTEVSMYPKLWKAGGIPYSRLIETLLELGMKRYRERKRLKTDYRINGGNNVL